MAFTFTLGVSIPGTSTGNIATTLDNALRSVLAEAADGLNRKQVGELFCRNAMKAAYVREVQRVDAAAATAADRAAIDSSRTTITTKEVGIKATEAALQTQADTDWA